MSREYIFTLEVEDEEVIWKCVVGENEVITYEGDVECKRLKIMNHEKKPGVLQIDCVTRVYDEILPFIKIDGVWVESDTTTEDKIQAKILKYKKESYVAAFAGLVLVVGYIIVSLIRGDWGEWPISPIMGIFFISCGAMTMVRLKNELDAMGRKLDWKLTWSDFKKKL